MFDPNDPLQLATNSPFPQLPVSYGFGSMTPIKWPLDAGLPETTSEIQSQPVGNQSSEHDSLLQLLNLAAQKDIQAQSVPIPKPVIPAFRTQDAIIGGGGALLAALLGGRRGADLAGQWVQGYLGGKAAKADQETNYALAMREQSQRVLQQEGQNLRQQASMSQATVSRQDQERMKYLDLARSLMTDLDRMSSGTASAFLARLRTVADRAGVPELAPSHEEEGQIVAGLIAADNRNLAAKMVPQLLTTLRSNGVPAARVTAGLMLLGIGRKHPELLDSFGVDPVEVSKSLAELSPRESRDEAATKKIQADTQTVDGIREAKIAKAESDAELAAIRARYLGPSLARSIEAKELQMAKLRQGMELADARFDLSLVKDRRQAAKLLADAARDLPKMRGLKVSLETEYRNLKERQNAIRAGMFALPPTISRSQALQQIDIALQQNAAKRAGIDQQGKSIEQNRAVLKEYLKRAPSDTLPGTFDKSGGSAALSGYAPVTIDPAQVQRPAPSGRSGPGFGAQNEHWYQSKAKPSPQTSKQKINIDSERAMAKAALAKFSAKGQEAQRKAIRDAFFKRTGVRL
ncbi:MAG TPA: hypothetical protein VJ835_12375 [Fimbriimonadaceae bacterium]|nr:hypothetical protein [Fimbriimonadaceae bacterium]